MSELHWLPNVFRLESPNQNARPSSVHVDLLVIHNISLPPDQYGTGYVQQFFLNRLNPDEHPYFDQIAHLQVSSHLFIERDGALTQFVPFSRRAWHAGVSVYNGRDNCNDFSIGIELEGSDHTPYTDAQYDRLVEVSAFIMNTYPKITSERIVGHCDIAPGRKTDPGYAFDWGRYRASLNKRLAGDL